MKRFLTGVLAVMLLGLAATCLEAGDGCGAAPCGPTFVEQKVTAYRCEYRTRKVERTVNQMFTREEMVPYSWTEWVREVTPVTQKVTHWVPSYKDVPVVNRVCEWYTENQPMRVTKYRMENVEEPCVQRVCEQVVTPVKRMVTTYRHEPKEVVDQVQVCRMVASCVGSGCGCRTACAPVWETVQVRRTVMNCIPETKEVVVNEVSFRWVEKPGVRRYTKCVPYQEDVVVPVRKCRWVEKPGTQRVCEMVPQVRDVTCNHVTCKPIVKQGTRKQVVCEWRPVKVMVDEPYCEMVPYETVVKVPVQACVSGGCGPRHGCGFFGRCGGCR